MVVAGLHDAKRSMGLTVYILLSFLSCMAACMHALSFLSCMHRYPEAVLEIPGSTFWAIMFFAMLLTLGLDSQFGTVEAVLAIMDDLGIKIVSRDEWVKVARTVCFCTVSFLVGLLFCTNSGLYYFQLFDMYSAALPLLFICLCELITVVWIYGIEKMIDHIEDMTGRTISRWWWWMWKWATPAIISLVLFWSFITAITEKATYSTPTGDKPYPPGFVFLGWCLIMMSTVLVPGESRGSGARLVDSVCAGNVR